MAGAGPRGAAGGALHALARWLPERVRAELSWFVQTRAEGRLGGLTGSPPPMRRLMRRRHGLQPGRPNGRRFTPPCPSVT